MSFGWFYHDSECVYIIIKYIIISNKKFGFVFKWGSSCSLHSQICESHCSKLLTSMYMPLINPVVHIPTLQPTSISERDFVLRMHTLKREMLTRSVLGLYSRKPRPIAHLVLPLWLCLQVRPSHTCSGGLKSVERQSQCSLRAPASLETVSTWADFEACKGGGS